MKKRIIAMVLSLMLAISIFPISASADYNGSSSTPSTRSGVFIDHYEIDIDRITYSVYFYSPYFLLVKGSQNEYVPIAQRALLNTKALYGINFESWSPITYYFGDKSSDATMAFQKWWNANYTYFYGKPISEDGQVGKQTWRRFETVCQ